MTGEDAILNIENLVFVLFGGEVKISSAYVAGFFVGLNIDRHFPEIADKIYCVLREQNMLVEKSSELFAAETIMIATGDSDPLHDFVAG